MFSTVETFKDFLEEHEEITVVLGSGKEYICNIDHLEVVSWENEVVETPKPTGGTFARVQFCVTDIEHVQLK